MILVAHRGDPRHAPENTLASFRAAADRGAGAVEMDLRRTAGGAWVVFHDPIPSRSSGEAILPLSEALEFCRARRLRVFLDIKVNDGEKPLAARLRSSGWLRHCVLLAGQLPTLRRWRRLFPRQPLFWVTGFRHPVRPRDIAQAGRLRLTGFVSYRRWVNRRTLERVHRAGLEIYVWTVRTSADLQRFARLGVDGIMSEVWPHHLPCPPKADGPSGRSRRRNRISRVAG